MIPNLLDKVWIVPALMASSFLIILFFGKRVGTRATAGIGIAAVSLALVFSVCVAGQWINRVNNPPTGLALAADVVAANGLTPQTGANIVGEIAATTTESGETSITLNDWVNKFRVPGC